MHSCNNINLELVVSISVVNDTDYCQFLITMTDFLLKTKLHNF